MPLYVVVDAQNRRVRQGLAESDVILRDENDAPKPLEPGLRIEVLAGRNAHPDEAVERWDAATASFVSVTPAILRTIISKREFRNRLGQAVRLQILALRRRPTPAQQSVSDLLEDLNESLLSVNEVDLENPDTVAGVNGLMTIGIISQADVTRILAPSTVAQE